MQQQQWLRGFWLPTATMAMTLSFQTVTQTVLRQVMLRVQQLVAAGLADRSSSSSLMSRLTTSSGSGSLGRSRVVLLPHHRQQQQQQLVASRQPGSFSKVAAEALLLVVAGVLNCPG
jgi:hypothetical protein